MVTKLTDSLIGLEPGLALTVERSRHQIVRCVENRLWLTQEGLLDDIVLLPGESFALEGHGKVVLEAVGGPARVALSGTAPVVSRLRTRLGQFMHQLGDMIEGRSTSHA